MAAVAAIVLPRIPAPMKAEADQPEGAVALESS
jgi:hypothetical protein